MTFMTSKKNTVTKCTLIALITILATSLLAGCSSNQTQNPAPAPEQAVTETKPNSFEAFGKVLAEEKLTLSLSENLKVDQILAQEGQLLKKNDPILSYNVNLLNAKKKVQQELLKVAKASTSDSDLILSKAQSELAYNQKVLLQATELYEKQQKLFESDALPKEELNRSLLSLQKAQTDVSVSQIEVNRILNDNKKKQLDQSRTYSEIQKDNLQLASVLTNSQDIQNGHIVSRFNNGVISKMNVTAGKFVTGGETLFELLNLDSRYVLAEVPEEFISKVTAGMSVEITPTAQKDKVYNGVVTSIWHTSIEKNGETMIPVRIALEQYENLLPNYNVDIRFLQSK